MQSVQSVQLWNRTDCCAERLTNFNVILLDASQSVISSVNYSGQAGATTTIQISGNARYVKVQLVGSDYLSLAEVKVFGQVHWLVTDQLGTPRIILDQTGSRANVTRHDYLPFGEELYAGSGNRAPELGYTGDNVRQKFTGYERDDETSLDFAQARYFASVQGRFTSTDPLTASGRAALPQSWNRYVYVLNNPLGLVDPTGLKDQDPNEQKRQQPPQAPPPSTQPPPVDISSGSRPLLPGEQRIPTSLVPLVGPNQTYNGNSVVSPTGTLVDGQPNHGLGRVVDYLILDQWDKPMGPETGVTWMENVTSSDPVGQALLRSGQITTSNGVPIRPESNGTVHDVVGPIARNPGNAQYASSGPSFTLTQTVTIGMPNPQNPARPQGV